MLLERQGLDVRCYDSADSFLKQRNLDDGGCLLLDHHMPNLSGIELLEVLRARRITTPAIMMTGGTDSLLADRARKAHALVVLQKPMVNGDLLHWIEKALDRSGEVNGTGQQAL
jgi:FixJ family two-component response regulator